MSPERSAQVERIFLAAIDVPKDQWPDVLARETQGDEALRREVEELLACHDDTFLDSKDAPGKGMLTELGASALSTDEAMLPPDRMIGRYRVMGRLGAGGMGIVYVAEQDRPKRTVALKLLRAGAVSPRLIRRFEYEAEILGRLHHPGIAQVFEAGVWTHEGITRPYMAMELVSGSTITKHAQDRGLTVRGKVELVAKVCDAMQHAHNAGVIHRDLKPANILVTAEGEPKVLDFGVARPVDADLQMTTILTGVGQFVGTIPYMSPEQVASDAGAVDVRSDVYALGVLLHELLTEKLPYDVRGKSLPEAARIIRDDPPERIGAIDRSLRGDLETIVLKAIDKDPRRRYQSAGSLGEDLRRFAAGRPVLAKQDSLLYVLRTQMKRHRAAFLAGAAFLIGIILFASYAAYSAAQNRLLAENERSAREQAQQLGEIAQRASERLRDELNVSQIENARLTGKVGNFAIAEASLWQHHLQNPSSRHTRWALWELYAQHRVLASVLAHTSLTASEVAADGSFLATCGRDHKVRLWQPPWLHLRAEWSEHAAEVLSLTIDPKSEIVVSGDKTGVLIAHHATTGQIVWRAKQNGEARVMRAVPEGGRIATADEAGMVRLFNLQDGRLLHEFRSGAVGVIDLATMPDGGLLSLSGDSLARQHDPSGMLVGVFAGHARGGVRTAKVLPGGSVITGGWDRTIRRWSLLDRRELARYDAPNGALQCISVNARGDLLATGGWYRVELLDPLTLTRKHHFNVSSTAMGVFFTANDSLLIATHAGGHVRVWDLRPRERLDLPLHRGRVAARQSPDGTMLATADVSGMLRLWDAGSGDPVASWQAHTARVTCLRFFPDRPLLVTAGEDGRLRVWNLNTRELVHEILSPVVVSNAGVDISPDGSMLAMSGPAPFLTIWRTSDWTSVARLPQDGYEYAALRFSPDGATLATTNRSLAITLWDTSTWQSKAVAQPQVRFMPWTPAFSPDGKVLALTSWGGYIDLRDARTLEPIGRLEGHSGLVTSADFSPVDPRLLMTSGVDGTIRLWDVAERRLLLTMPQAEGTEAITSDFSRDGSTVAMGGSHGMAALIDLGYFDRHILGGANMVIASPAVSSTAAEPPEPPPAASVAQIRAWASEVESKPWPRLGTPAFRPNDRLPPGSRP